MNGVVLSLASSISQSLSLLLWGEEPVLYIIIPSTHSFASLGLLHVEHMPIERVAPRKAGTDGVTLPVNGWTMENGNQS